MCVQDEATSALDSHTEREISGALAEVARGRRCCIARALSRRSHHVACSSSSTIIIAHRLSTITAADEILVLKAGAIVERGTHVDLIAAGGEYASMWHLQSTKASDDDDDDDSGGVCV